MHICTFYHLLSNFIQFFTMKQFLISFTITFNSSRCDLILSSIYISLPACLVFFLFDASFSSLLLWSISSGNFQSDGVTFIHRLFGQSPDRPKYSFKWSAVTSILWFLLNDIVISNFWTFFLLKPHHCYQIPHLFEARWSLCSLSSVDHLEYVHWYKLQIMSPITGWI